MVTNSFVMRKYSLLLFYFVFILFYLFWQLWRSICKRPQFSFLWKDSESNVQLFASVNEWFFAILNKLLLCRFCLNSIQHLTNHHTKPFGWILRSNEIIFFYTKNVVKWCSLKTHDNYVIVAFAASIHHSPHARTQLPLKYK